MRFVSPISRNPETGVISFTLSSAPQSVNIYNAEGDTITGSWASAGNTWTFTPITTDDILLADWQIVVL